VILQVANSKNAKEVWDTLKTRNVGVDRVQKAKLQTLKSEFEMLQMEEDETIDSFTAKMTSITSKMTSLGTTLDDSTRVRKLLNSVPEKYIQIVASIEQYSDLDKLTLDEAIGRLKTYEERIKVKKGKIFNHQDKLLFARHDKDNGRRHRYDNQGRGRYVPPHNRSYENARQHGRYENHSKDTFKSYNEEKKSPQDQEGFTRNVNEVRCYNCNKLGHYASNCRRRPQRQQRQEASNLVEEDLEPQLLMASTSFNKTTPTNESNSFANFYDDEDLRWGKIILDEDEGRHNEEHETKEDYDEISVEDQRIKNNDIYEERKPKIKSHFWSTITSKLVQKIKHRMKGNSKNK